MQHSKIVGGSTAKRVLNCPGSVALVQRMPPQQESSYAAEGTFLHAAMESLLKDNRFPPGIEFTPEQQDKLNFCVEALDEIDPNAEMVYDVEQTVEFEGVKNLDGVFGNVDFIGRVGDRVVVLDWKFGDGIPVPAEDNPQGLFYAAAARYTSDLNWLWEDATEIEIVIVQPPHIRRWVTTHKRLDEFVYALQQAIKEANSPNASLAVGDWCKWCTAKPICPQMTGAIDRVVHTKLEMVDPVELARALALADKLEMFIADARKLAYARLEKSLPVPGYKLVAKRAVRQWTDHSRAETALLNAGLTPGDIFETKLISPPQAEKLLKKSKRALPQDVVVAVSSGSTLAPEDDPRPAVLNLGPQLVAALSKLQ